MKCKFFNLVLIACLILGVTKTDAATCFCKLSTDELLGRTTATGVVKDLTSLVNKTYLTQGAFQQDACLALCSNKADYLDKRNLAIELCAAGVPLGSNIQAYGAVGTKIYRSSKNFGILTDSLTILRTQYLCPAGWLANTTNIDGGETTDKLCKKLAAQPITVLPIPSDGTPIGVWGFTWGNAMYAWGTSANGGAAYGVPIYNWQRECHF